MPVQIGNVVKNSVGEEVFFNEPHKPFHFPLGKRMTWLAELCFKANGFHEGFVILLPHRAPFQVAMENDAFHVVGKNESGDPHVLEGMDHTDEYAGKFEISTDDR